MLHVYTDGSSFENPSGPCGMGIVVVASDENTVLHTWSASKELGSNNQAEMLAAILALEHLPTTEEVVIYSDSQYVVKGITQWVPAWKKRDWRTAEGSPVKNQDLWERFEAAIEGRGAKTRVTWVKGHIGNRFNEIADILAGDAAQTRSDSPLSDKPCPEFKPKVSSLPAREKPRPMSKRMPKLDLSALLTEGVWKALEKGLDSGYFGGEHQEQAEAGLDLLRRYFDPIGVRAN